MDRARRRFSVVRWSAVVLLGIASSVNVRGQQVFVIDSAGSRVLRVDTATGRVTTFVPAGHGGLEAPANAVLGPDGNLYVLSTAAQHVLKFHGGSGRFLGVFLHDAALADATDLTFGPDDALYFSVGAADSVLRFDETEGRLSPFASAVDTPLVGARALAFDADGNLYVAGSRSHNVARFNTAGEFEREFIAPRSGGLEEPDDLQFAPDGALYVASHGSNGILRFDAMTGAFIDLWVGWNPDREPVPFRIIDSGLLYLARGGALRVHGTGRNAGEVLLSSTTTVEAVTILAAGADLNVPSLSAPTNSATGATIAISDTTKNRGTGRAEASRTKFYWSTNNALEPLSDTLLGFRDIPPLDPSLTSSGKTSVVIPTGLPVGKYWLFAEADADDQVAETDEANNVRFINVYVGPDLRVTGLSASSPVVAGTPFSANDTIKNAGGQNITVETTLRFFLSLNSTIDASDINLGSHTVAPLNAGQSVNSARSLTVPLETPPGAWKLIARADDGNSVVESDETNNTRVLALPMEAVAPTANAGPDQDVGKDAVVTLDGSASSDPDNQLLTYRWTQTFGADVTGGVGYLTGVRPSFSAPAEVTTVLFDLVVNDGTYTSPGDRVQINVMEDPAQAFFVRTNGSDSNPGTRAAPLRTVQEAINRARVSGLFADVYIAAGPYTTAVPIFVANGVSLYGGFDGADWVRRLTTALSDITLTTRKGVVAENVIVPTTIDALTIRSGNATGVTPGALLGGASSFGLQVVRSPGLIVRRSAITAGNGAAGAIGSSPGAAARGGNAGEPYAVEGHPYSCSDPTLTGAGGSRGLSSAGRPGGDGGRGGCGARYGQAGYSAPSGTAGGAGGYPGLAGRNGASGANGTPGANGAGGLSGVLVNGKEWHAGNGGVGTSGTPGDGGGGGGGGGGTRFCIILCFEGRGDGGGGGGGGGAGGLYAGAGGGGGGSIAVLVFDSTGAQFISNTFQSSNGGVGGAGGTGGAGGDGGAGSYGAGFETSQIDAGGNGGYGGRGGRGGHGGSGSGGDSYAVMQWNTQIDWTGNVLLYGLPGAAGFVPFEGNRGMTGAAGPQKICPSSTSC